MFLTKVDLAALMLHNFSAGMPGLILLSAGVIGDWSVLSHLVSLFLFLVKSGTVLRVLWRGGAAAAPQGAGASEHEPSCPARGRSLTLGSRRPSDPSPTLFRVPGALALVVQPLDDQGQQRGACVLSEDSFGAGCVPIGAQSPSATPPAISDYGVFSPPHEVACLLLYDRRTA